MRKPNIVIFNPDQFRADALGHLGNKASVTPNLDKVVESDGVSFRYAFCQNPVCTPSRCSFMSGWYTHVRGHRTMYHMMQREEPVLLKTLKDNGYFVWWGGKNDLVPGQKSFEPYCNVKHKATRKLDNLHKDNRWRGNPDEDNYYSFYAGNITPENGKKYYDSDWDNILAAVDFIKNAPDDKPFCVYLPLAYPHPPYGVEEPWYSITDRSKIPERIPTPEGWQGKPSLLKGIHKRQNLKEWTEERWTELRAVYLGMCSRIDHHFGMIIDALKQSGEYDNTSVFVFSDHGDFTGDYGLVEKTQNTFEDVLTRVPFIIKPPTWLNINPGIRNSLVELVDFPATCEELTGIKPEHTHFGRSLVPLLKGEVNCHRDAVFCEGGRLHGEKQCMELESNSSQNPKGLYWPRVNLQQSEGPEHTKAVMIRTKDYKYVRRLYEEDELYCLKSDPKELENRINDPQLREVKLKLKERLLTFYLETCDVVPFKTDERRITMGESK